MKKLIFALVVILVLGLEIKTANASNKEKEVSSIGAVTTSQNTFENGKHTARVHFSTYNGKSEDYKLNVEVENDRVVAIYYGKNEPIHAGYNTSNYYYSGGNLSFDRDMKGNLVGANTLVTVYYPGIGSVLFDISF